MTNKERLSLAIFAHAKPVPFTEYLYLNFFSGARLKPKEAGRVLQKFCFSGLVERLHVGGSKETDSYLLTRKGDKFFREAQVERGGSYRYYHYVERENLDSISKWSDGGTITEDQMLSNLHVDDPDQRQMINYIKANKRRSQGILNEIKQMRAARGIY